MRSLRLSLSYLLSGLLVFSLLAPSVAASSDNTRVATIKEAEGNVFLKKAGGQREFNAVQGMGLTKGDLIRTERRSNAEIIISQGNEIVIGENTKVMVSELMEEAGNEQSSLKVWAGNVWNRVKRLVNADDEFEVETPTSIMGVRGTLFLVTVNPLTGEEGVFVFDGLVEVSENTSIQRNRQMMPEPSRGVNLGSQLQNSFTEREQNRETIEIDIESIVQQVDPTVIEAMLTDVIEVSEEREREIEKDILTEEKERLELALYNTIQVSLMTTLVDEMIEQVKRQTEKREEVERRLQERQRSLEQLQDRNKELLDRVTEQRNLVEQRAREVQLQLEERMAEELKQFEERQNNSAQRANRLRDIAEQERRAEQESSSPPSPPSPSPPPVTPGPSDPTDPEEPIIEHHVRVQVQGEVVSVLARNITTPIYGIQVHLGVDLDKLGAQPIGLGNQLYPVGVDEVHSFKNIDFEGANDELMFTQIAEEGVAIGEEERVLVKWSIHPLEGFDIKLLEVLLFDANGNKIENVTWKN